MTGPLNTPEIEGRCVVPLTACCARSHPITSIQARRVSRDAASGSGRSLGSWARNQLGRFVRFSFLSPEQSFFLLTRYRQTAVTRQLGPSDSPSPFKSVLARSPFSLRGTANNSLAEPNAFAISPVRWHCGRFICKTVEDANFRPDLDRVHFKVPFSSARVAELTLEMLAQPP